MNKRCSWRIIEADGHAERVTRDGAAYYLRTGRKLGRKWVQIENGWKAVGKITTKVRTLNNTMRHVDTISAISAKYRDNSTLGVNLANEIDALLSFDLDKPDMVKELARMVAHFMAERAKVQERFVERGKAIDAAVYSDGK